MTTAVEQYRIAPYIPARPRESGDPGSRTPALVALDSRVRGNERNMLPQIFSLAVSRPFAVQYGLDSVSP